MSSGHHGTASAITAAILSHYRIDLTAEGARETAQFYKHVLYYLNHHLPEEAEPSGPVKLEPNRLVRR
jgi:hypothetical protein